MSATGPNTKYFDHHGPHSLNEVAEYVGASVPAGFDEDLSIKTLAPLATAGDGAISFFADKRYRKQFETTAATACLVTEKLAGSLPDTVVPLLTNYPHAAFAKAASLFFTERRFAGNKTAIDETADIHASAVISPGCAIGPDVSVGENSYIGANVVLGPGVTIGDNCEIAPGVSIRCAALGNGVKVAANSAIGEAGFGATSDGQGPVDIPQLGGVIIGNDVTIGACTTIDRGAFDNTVLEDRVKVDNLVQIAHNVRVGMGTVLAAHTGISGSANIGRGVQLAGRAGIADHVDIGDGARVGAASGVMNDIPAGETWAGYPAKPIRQWLRETVILARMAKQKTKQPEEA